MTFSNYTCSVDQHIFGSLADKHLIGGIAWIEHGQAAFSWIELWKVEEQFYMYMHAQGNEQVHVVADGTPAKAMMMLDEFSALYSRMSYLHRYKSVEDREKLLQYK